MLPPSNCSRRTRTPTETASSTSPARICGVETATSTPQDSLNNQWFFGWFTRAMTRGTANSCLARSEMTRLSSSSPVTATMTSTWSMSRAVREATSQASAATNRMPFTGSSELTRSTSLSMSMTSWPLEARSSAKKRPTFPAPATATLIRQPLPQCHRRTASARPARSRSSREAGGRRPLGRRGPGSSPSACPSE